MASAKNNGGSKRSMSKSKKNKHYPVQRSMIWPLLAGSGLSVIRADYGLSALNRRLYRQNRVYRVKVEAVGKNQQSFDVFKLRDTFMLQRGYQLAMEEWIKSYEEANEVVKDNVKARWRDFRIDVKPHVSDTLLYPANLRSYGSGAQGRPVVVDEFVNSVSYTPAGASRDFGLKSDSNTFDIITEYNKQGKVQTDPNLRTTEAAYEELYADLPDAKVENLQADGNQPPYDADDAHPLDVLEYVGTVSTLDEGWARTSTGYFDAPLGAIFIFGGGMTGTAGQVAGIPQYSDGGETVPNPDFYKITVQHGDYKGVHAPEYVDTDGKEL